MSNIRKHVVRPLNNQASYKEFSNIDFLLNFDARKMIPGTLRINGRLKVYSISSGNQYSGGQIPNVYIDPSVGASIWLDTMTTTTANQGTLESFSDYYRYKKLVQTSMATMDDAQDIHSQCEMVSSSQNFMNDMMQGEKVKGVAQPDPNTQKPSSFSINPLIILNQVSSLDGSVPAIRGATVGDVRLSIRTSSNGSVFYGANSSSDIAYEVQDLFVTFKSIPDDGVQGKLLLRPKFSVRQTLQSGLSIFSANAPIVARSVSLTFITQSLQSNPQYNSCRLERPPNVTRVEYFTNDNNSLLTYPLQNQEEIVKYGLDSMGADNINNCSLANLYSNNSYVAGISFGSPIDLSKNSFQMRLESGISGTSNSMQAHALFHGIMEM